MQPGRRHCLDLLPAIIRAAIRVNLCDKIRCAHNLINVTVRSDRSAAARWCRLVSTKDSGHYGA